MIELLTGCGSKVDAKNRYTSSPLDYIQAQGYQNITDYLAAIRRGNIAVKSGPNSRLYTRQKLSTESIELQPLPISSEPSAATGESLDGHALYQLGQHYSDGINPINPSWGFEYFKKAADMGHIDAKALMGRAMLLGLGTAQDYSAAEVLTREALDKGSAEALYVMGIKYYYGIGAKKDKSLGIIYLAQAQSNGSVYAAKQLRRFFAEDALEHIKTADNRAEIKTYLLSAGAMITEGSVDCDAYSIKTVIPPEYGLNGVIICYTPEDVKHSLNFDIAPNIDPVYKEFLLNYLEVH
jgi:TPR repeat protein